MEIHCAFFPPPMTPPSRNTFSQRSVSFCRNVVNAGGVEPTGFAPTACSLSLSSGLASTFASTAWIAATRRGGVLLGAC
jgi:hypothetical protein